MNYFEDCSTLDEAKKVYWKLAKQFHPDKGGNEEDFKILNNQFHAFRPEKEKFKNEAFEWDSEVYASILDQLIHIDGLIIDVVGSWLWLSGATKANKEAIKAIDHGGLYKRGWHKEKEMWYFSPKGYRKTSKKNLSLDEIKAFYGSETVKARKEDDRKEKKTSQPKQIVYKEYPVAKL